MLLQVSLLSAMKVGSFCSKMNKNKVKIQD